MNLKEDAMLEKVDLTKKISKEEYKAKMPQTGNRTWQIAERMQRTENSGDDCF